MYTESYAELHKRLIRNLQEKLEEKGGSQHQQILEGLNSRYISRIKQGKRKIGIRTIWKICRTFGFDPKEIFK